MAEKHWRYNEQGDPKRPFACTYPGCSFRSAHEGGVNLHYKKAHGESGSDDGGAKCPDCGRPGRLLNLGDPTEKRAHDSGLTFICPHCEEVWK